jgi:acyl transferase domain-containing protein
MTAASYLLALAARDARSLHQLAQACRVRLQQLDCDQALEFCAAICVHGTHRRSRLALAAVSKAGLEDQLDRFLERWRAGRAAASAIGMDAGGPVFVFNGLGSEAIGAVRELLCQEPIFRSVAEQCDALFKHLGGWRVLECIAALIADERPRPAYLAPCATFVLQIGVAELLRSWGVVPAAVVGHSLGEVSAAYVAGALSMADAATVLYHRIRLLEPFVGCGGMLAVDLSPEGLGAYVAHYGERVCIGVVNGPQASVISGDIGCLQHFGERMSEEGVSARMLDVEMAYHSPLMDLLRDATRQSLAALMCGPAVCAIYSSVTGARIEGAQLDGTYWWRNMRETVQFENALGACFADGHRVFVEVGAQPVLIPYITQCLTGHGIRGMALATLRKNRSVMHALSKSLGALYCAGAEIDWRSFYHTRQRTWRTGYIQSSYLTLILWISIV